MRKLSVILLALVLGRAFAAAPVVDVGDESAKGDSGNGEQQFSTSQQAGDEIYNQLQMLQEEVRDLRGVVEEQSHEIRQLKQRQMDDYQDLDRRISALMKAGPAATESSGLNATAPQEEAETENTGAANATTGERESYLAAYDLLKNRKIDQAVAAFKKHLQQYPNGDYAANAYYWLGEIYLLKNDLDKAQQSFATVVNDFPKHRKAPDAMFKLGKVYDLEGNKTEARKMLERAAKTDSSAAALAKAYLKDNFQ